LTDPPVESVYSGVVSLRSTCLAIFLSELNSLCLNAADIGNTYLEAKTVNSYVSLMHQRSIEVRMGYLF
jgi:hypothetical protein